MNRLFAATMMLAALFVSVATAETMVVDDNGYPIQALAAGTTQTASYSANTEITNTVGGTGETVVRLVCTTNCHFDCTEATPTATTADPFLPALIVEYIRVNNANRCSFIQNSSSGTAYVTEMQ